MTLRGNGSRFSVSAAEDYLHAAFPATLKAIRHVVINSYAQSQLAYPQRFEFDRRAERDELRDTAAPPDGYTDDLRAALGIQPGEYLLLQPTRIVPRKRIERALGLAVRLGLPYALVISHEAGDEGSEYVDYLQELIDSFQGARDLCAQRTSAKSAARPPTGASCIHWPMPIRSPIW